jgi:hypothetical protein
MNLIFTQRIDGDRFDLNSFSLFAAMFHEGDWHLNVVASTTFDVSDDLTFDVPIALFPPTNPSYQTLDIGPHDVKGGILGLDADDLDLGAQRFHRPRDAGDDGRVDVAVHVGEPLLERQRIGSAAPASAARHKKPPGKAPRSTRCTAWPQPACACPSRTTSTTACC